MRTLSANVETEYAEPTRFADRTDAGRRLGLRLVEGLGGWPGGGVLVLALPRGGVPVAAEVARLLRVPLDVLVARKLGAPWQPELALGAIAPDGVRVLNEEVVAQLGVTAADVDRIAAREARELERRMRRYRGERPFPPVQGRTVVLVDDGVATGATARAAIAWLRRQRPARIVLAAPVIGAATLREFRALADDVVAVLAPDDLEAIGLWYDDFGQVSDEEVVAALEDARRAPPATTAAAAFACEVQVPVGQALLAGTLEVPAAAAGLVIFAHGSGSSRQSPRNRAVARVLGEAGLGTLLMDLLTPAEERHDEAGGRLRFDVALLAERLVAAMAWCAGAEGLHGLPVGLFGASTGAAAALLAAAQQPGAVAAVVSRGGRPDLAGEAALARVRAPTLLIVGGADEPVIGMNRWALARLAGEKRLAVVPHATHLFPEPGALEQVARLAVDWFTRHLAPQGGER